MKLKYLFLFASSILVAFIIYSCVRSGSSRKTANSSDDSLVDIAAELDPSVVMSDSVANIFWKDKMFKDSLEIPEIITDTNATINIEAFKHKYSRDLPATWVLGYVNGKSNIHTLPGPIFEQSYSQPTTVVWVNRLKETMLDSASGYPWFRYQKAIQKYYPIIYDTTNPLFIPSLAHLFYPVNTANVCNSSQSYLSKPNEKECRCPDTTEMSAYYSTTVHLHGAWVSWHDDGYPNAFYLNTESSERSCNGHFPKNATKYGLFGPGIKYDNDSQLSRRYRYYNTFGEALGLKNSNRDTLGLHGAILWYHDHAMMRTACNVYSGLAGAYIIDGKDEAKNFKDAFGFDIRNPGAGSKTHDIPLLISDKSFNKNGFLYYNTTQNTNTDDSGQPEFYGQTITVNGKVWPYQTVDRGLYRFRILNTSSSRYLSFALMHKVKGKYVRLLYDSLFYQIGTEGGIFKLNPDSNEHFPLVTFDSSLTLAPGERADVLINFSGVTDSSLYLVNRAIDSPFQNYYKSLIRENWYANDTSNVTNMVMKFNIGQSENCKITNEALKIGLDKLLKILIGENVTNKLLPKNKIENYSQTASFITRQDSMFFENREMKMPARRKLDTTVYYLDLTEYSCSDSFKSQFINGKIRNNPSMQGYWNNRLKELSFPMVLMNDHDWSSEAFDSAKFLNTADNNGYVFWEIKNNTNDAHPIHLHLNRFQILGRIHYDTDNRTMIDTAKPLRNEIGWKDVVRVDPHSLTKIFVQFVLRKEDEDAGFGQFVYHCHILEHEDMSMMRRLIIKSKKKIAK